MSQYEHRATGRSYPGLDQRSIKVIWEQHDQSGVEISPEVYTSLAEDASYKLWELINNIKIYSRHSGGIVTYDLINEVFRDADVPPALGAMDSDWERMDYDETFFFYSDKIVELREEYQRDVKIELPGGPDFTCSFPVVADNIKSLSTYVSNLLYIALFGETQLMDKVLAEAAFSSCVCPCFREFLNKIIQTIVLKQSSGINLRCWRLLRAFAINPFLRGVENRKELFHLAEILTCQLLGPMEKIRDHSIVQVKPEVVNIAESVQINMNEKVIQIKSEYEEEPGIVKVKQEEQTSQEEMPLLQETDPSLPAEKVYKLITNESGITEMVESTVCAAQVQDIPKMELNEQRLGENLDVKTNFMEHSVPELTDVSIQKIYKLITDDDVNASPAEGYRESSGFISAPLPDFYVDELCQTCGSLAAMNCYFQRECTYNIVRRLERFFCGRNISTKKEFQFINRAVRGLIALGEYAFREFIPFIYKLNPDDLPESIWTDFATAAVYLRGADDIFLYEWLEYVCGGDKMQPFLTYYARFFERFFLKNYVSRKSATFKIIPKVVPRRLEWNALAAAMCHGDDPNKALKPKPTLEEMFPELSAPITQQTEPNTRIRFKFSGCRPVAVKRKLSVKMTNVTDDPASGSSCGIRAVYGQNDIVIARRKLFKPLTNEHRVIRLSSYYYTTL